VEINKSFWKRGARSQKSGARRIEREPARRFKELIVWQKAHRFVLAAYQISQAFPKNELYDLASQLRRAAVSIPANIAEGFTRKTKAEKARF